VRLVAYLTPGENDFRASWSSAVARLREVLLFCEKVWTTYYVCVVYDNKNVPTPNHQHNSNSKEAKSDFSNAFSIRLLYLFPHTEVNPI